jgi:hypothetical protein
MSNIDKAIESKSQDILNRATFSEEVAKVVSNWDGEDCLVMSICGDWGTGKTSIKNMITESLSSSQKDCEIIEFNPWYWSGQEQLIEAFFREIGLKLGKKNTKTDLASKWNAYGKSLSFGGNISKTLSIWSILLSKPEATLVFYTLTILFDKASSLTLQGAEMLKAYREASHKSISDVKEELNNKLLEQKKKYLIVIDDIDRLTKHQINLMFQLVKVNADFHNFVYLLMFQKDVVVKALQDGTSDSGEEYLEKIIQMSFDIPSVNELQIRQLLNTEIANLITKISIKIDDSEIDDLKKAIEYASTYLNTLRDLKRFISCLEIKMRFFGNNINLSNLIIMETIRIHDNQIYYYIFQNKYMLVGKNINNQFMQKENEFIDRIVKISDKKDIIKSIIFFLFPRERFNPTSTPVSTIERAINTNKAFQSNKIASADYFDRYFELFLPDNSLSFEDKQEIKLNYQNKGFLSNKLLISQKAKQIEILKYLQSINFEEGFGLFGNVFSIISPEIINFIDELDFKQVTNEQLDVIQKSLNIIRSINIHKYNDVIKDSNGLLVPTILVNSIDIKELPANVPSELAAHELQIQKIKESLMVNIPLKIKNSIENDTLKDNPWCEVILQVYKSWGYEEEVTKYLNKLSSEGKDYRKIVCEDDVKDDFIALLKQYKIDFIFSN